MHYLRAFHLQPTAFLGFYTYEFFNLFINLFICNHYNLLSSTSLKDLSSNFKRVWGRAPCSFFFGVVP